MVRAVAYLDDMVLCQPVLLVPLLLTPGLVQHLQIDDVRRRSPGYDAILVPQPPVSTTTRHPQRGRAMRYAALKATWLATLNCVALGFPTGLALGAWVRL